MTEYPPGEFLLRLFPLPNLVFFPRTRIPLHVFEPRYRQMISDALASDERIGVVLLRPGWEANYFGAPPIHSYGTLGAIERAVKLEDGRYNLVVNGLVRFEMLESIAETPYRIAKVVASPERSLSAVDAWARREWLVDLSRRYLELLPGQTEVPELDSASLDAIVNALVMSLNLTVEEKQALLELHDLMQRAEEVGQLLEQRLQVMTMLAPYRHTGDPGWN
jgi:Lon protease-like protein